jgi:hypothetical protein
MIRQLDDCNFLTDGQPHIDKELFYEKNRMLGYACACASVESIETSC